MILSRCYDKSSTKLKESKLPLPNSTKTQYFNTVWLKCTQVYSSCPFENWKTKLKLNVFLGRQSPSESWTESSSQSNSWPGKSIKKFLGKSMTSLFQGWPDWTKGITWAIVYYLFRALVGIWDFEILSRRLRLSKDEK